MELEQNVKKKLKVGTTFWSGLWTDLSIEHRTGSNEINEETGRINPWSWWCYIQRCALSMNRGSGVHVNICEQLKRF